MRIFKHNRSGKRGGTNEAEKFLIRFNDHNGVHRQIIDARIIDATEKSPAVFCGLNGAARALCCRLSVATGYRYSELKSLTSASFDFARCTVKLEGRHAKNGKDITNKLPMDLSNDLRSYLANLASNAPAFAFSNKQIKGENFTTSFSQIRYNPSAIINNSRYAVNKIHPCS